jgi:DNA primase
MDQVDQVRQKTDIVELIGSYISLKKAGRNFKALCPFHSEKTPSFIVSPERQIWKCFGCSLGGDVFTFLMEYEKMTFGEALKMLADKAGIKLDSYRPSADQQQKDKLLNINHLASELYHYILLNHKVGQKGLLYLKQRGIGSSQIKLYKLGYAPDAWETLIKFLGAKKSYKLKDLEQSGLIIKGKKSYYDRFRGRITFPLEDHRGNILGFSGRTLKPDLKGAKYINSPETQIYHKGRLFYGLKQAKKTIKDKDAAVLVEGEFDAISSYKAGVKNVVATKGSALTEDQVNLIKRFCSKIVLALDADAAGSEAAKRGIEIAEQADLAVRVTQIEYGKDPDEFARHSPKGWRQAVKKAIPIYDFYIKNSLSRFNKNTAEGKKNITAELLPILGRIVNEVVKSHYLKKLAGKLGMGEEILIREMDRLSKKQIKSSWQTPKTAKLTQKPESKTRREILEEYILSLIIQAKKQTSGFLKDITLKHLGQPAVVKILTKLKSYMVKKDKLDINLFAKSLPSELLQTFDRLYMQDLENVLEDEKKLEKEFEKTRQEIRTYYLKQKINDLAEKIKNAEKDKDFKKLKSLREKFALVSSKLKGLS